MRVTESHEQLEKMIMELCKVLGDDLLLHDEVLSAELALSARAKRMTHEEALDILMGFAALCIFPTNHECPGEIHIEFFDAAGHRLCAAFGTNGQDEGEADALA